MSVEPIELMGEVWTRWQGHIIHDTFPLGRFLGCSDHGGVFQTTSAALGSSVVAIKLLAADDALAESQLSRWESASRLVHPHLLKLLQWGQCQLDGLPYLYTVMEYADQTLAQLLQRRALTQEEAREMLRPTLDALAFLHGQNLVHGRLKPENILVVGDHLKLASDTIHRVGEPTMSAQASTAGYTTAGDIRALGVCLFEALTRRSYPGRGESNEAVALPADFSPSFRDVVARCLSPSPQDRPSATDLMAWASGQAEISAPETIVQPVAIQARASATLAPPTQSTLPPAAAPESARPALRLQRSPKRRALLTSVLALGSVLALVWAGVHMVGSHGEPPSPSPAASVAQAPSTTPAVSAEDQKPIGVSPNTSTLALHEVIPQINQRTRRTISGHIKVSVRIIVNPDGSVISATADRVGGSKYLGRLAVEAARDWTFPPIATQARRVMQLRFDFGREDTTAAALAQ